MSINLSIKNAPDAVVALLKLRAQRNHRSLQGELLAIVEDAVRESEPLTPYGLSEGVAKWEYRTSSDAAAVARADHERDIERAVALMRDGLSLGDHRFTRDEMHER